MTVAQATRLNAGDRVRVKADSPDKDGYMHRVPIGTLGVVRGVDRDGNTAYVWIHFDDVAGDGPAKFRMYLRDIEEATA